MEYCIDEATELIVKEINNHDSNSFSDFEFESKDKTFIITAWWKWDSLSRVGISIKIHELTILDDSNELELMHEELGFLENSIELHFTTNGY